MGRSVASAAYYRALLQQRLGDQMAVEFDDLAVSAVPAPS